MEGERQKSRAESGGNMHESYGEPPQRNLLMVNMAEPQKGESPT